ncbi:cytochrome c oxidase subunit 3 [Larkinella punicea]|uniref:Cytochrome oxidase subunit III n=1 Tax=Larkinella punicea TaxID=2315727 RepID=A0A368JPK9_9BACT|nr:cytochrome c oxidase subunit 3 [Larkinella punicea]RCR69255.1 cytochrome oxidase subunit III [Larkinella punicea]
MSELVKVLPVAEEPEETLSMNPKKFIVWMFVVSIVMLFAAMTSAYLVRRAEGNWLEFKMPAIFMYSTVVLLISSFSMHWAYRAAKKDDFGTLRTAISITFAFGLAFLVMQFIGWKDLVAQNVYFVGNPSGSFMYVFTGLHAFHLVSGLIVLLYALRASFQLKIHAKNLTQLEVCMTYWHFLDILWVYLFGFLLYFN